MKADGAVRNGLDVPLRGAVVGAFVVGAFGRQFVVSGVGTVSCDFAILRDGVSLLSGH